MAPAPSETPRKPERRLPFALALAIGLAASAGLLFALVRPGSPPEPVDAPASALSEAQTKAPAVPSAALPMPPPFDERDIRLPEPGAPPASETAAYCDPQNWSGVTIVRGHSGDSFRVDEAAWSATLASSRAGLAAWMSQCQQGGGPIAIVADESGALLARYDPRTGLQSLPR